MDTVAADKDRVMEALIALGGEVFVLRAELEAMRQFCIQDDDAAAKLEDIRRGTDFQAWLSTEGERFASNLLAPLAGRRSFAT